MIRKESFGLMSAVAVASLILVVSRLQAAEPPVPPALSSLVPVEDLVAQVEYYVEELEECVADSEEYEDSVEKIEQHTIAKHGQRVRLGVYKNPRLGDLALGARRAVRGQ